MLRGGEGPVGSVSIGGLSGGGRYHFAVGRCGRRAWPVR